MLPAPIKSVEQVTPNKGWSMPAPLDVPSLCIQTGSKQSGLRPQGRRGRPVQPPGASLWWQPAWGAMGRCWRMAARYTGSYADSVSSAELQAFHADRLRVLAAEPGIDVLIFETLPCASEVRQQGRPGAFSAC